jgi:ABC-type transport system substrate-binding protein
MDMSSATEGSMWGGYMPYRNDEIPFIEYDPDKAKEYLAKSVYKAKRWKYFDPPLPATFLRLRSNPAAAEQNRSQNLITITDNAGLQAACSRT